MEWTKENKIRKKKNFAAAILDYFWAKMFTSETTYFHYFSPRIPNLLQFWTSNFGKWGKKTFNQSLKVNIFFLIHNKKNSCGNFRPFLSKKFQIWHLLLLPKDSESLKLLDIQHREVGGKRRLNGTSKGNRQTHGHTDGHFNL